MVTHTKATSSAEDLLDAAKRAIIDLGQSDVEIKSIKVELAKRGSSCPPGTTPVWGVQPQPDGSFVYGYICK
jgi:hypothetical protein